MLAATHRRRRTATAVASVSLCLGALLPTGCYSDEPGSQKSPLPPMDGLEQPDRGDFLAILGVKRHQSFSQGLAAAMLFRMSFNADVTSFIIEGNATGREYAALQQKYDTGDPINALVSVPEGESVAQGAVLARLLEFAERIQGLEGVRTVATVIPETNPITGSVNASVNRGMAPRKPTIAGFMPSAAAASNASKVDSASYRR